MNPETELRINKLVNYAIRMCDKSLVIVRKTQKQKSMFLPYNLYAPAICSVLLAAASDGRYHLSGDGADTLNALIDNAHGNPEEFVIAVEQSWKEKLSEKPIQEK